MRPKTRISKPRTQFISVMADKTDYFSMNEIDKLLKFCYDNSRIRDYLLILTLFRTGRRISEVVGTKPWTRNPGLRPIDIKDDGLIEWSILKKNPISSRYLNSISKAMKPLKIIMEERRLHKPLRVLKPVDDYLLKLILQYCQSMNIPPYKRIFPITRQRADQIIKKVAGYCNITRNNKGIHVHQFRHSLAINFLKINPKDPSALIKLKKILEHTSIELTEHYTQFTQEDIRESLNKTFNPKEDAESDDRKAD